jgi:hypothetical protein
MRSRLNSARPSEAWKHSTTQACAGLWNFHGILWHLRGMRCSFLEAGEIERHHRRRAIRLKRRRLRNGSYTGETLPRFPGRHDGLDEREFCRHARWPEQRCCAQSLRTVHGGPTTLRTLQERLHHRNQGQSLHRPTEGLGSWIHQAHSLASNGVVLQRRLPVGDGRGEPSGEPSCRAICPILHQATA